MSSFLARVSTQQQLRVVHHTSVSGDTRQLIRRGTTSGAGAADGTTLVDSVLTAAYAADNDLNGYYWIKLLSGAAKGQRKRIVDYTTATGTCTLENNGFGAQVASAVEYELWKSPEPIVRVTSSSGATSVTDTGRTEAADTWKDHYLLVISGSQRGRVGAITASTTGGALTITAASGSLGLTGALTVGDVCKIGKFVECSNVSSSLTEEYIPREGDRVNFSMGDGVIGPRAGTISFNTKIRPSGTLAAAASKANKSTISGLLQGCGLVEVQDTSSTAGAGSSTTAIKLATASWENHTIGGAVIWNGNMTFIDSSDDGGAGVDTLNVTPALPQAPAASDVIYAVCMYRKSLDADTYGITIEYERDGVLETLTGCKGNVTLQDGSAPEMSWSFSVDDWTREIEAAPYNAVDAYETQSPVRSQDRLAYLGSTATNVNAVTATPGTQVVPKPVQGSIGNNGRAGFQITGFACSASWRELLDSSTDVMAQEERWNERTSSKLAVVYGSHEGTFAVRVPAARHVEFTALEDEGGLMVVRCGYGAHDAGVAADGGSTLRKVPDFAFYLS